MSVIEHPINKYIVEVAEYMKENPKIRYGQALFNVLFSTYPNLANEILGTYNDPYYASTKYDQKITNFWNWLTVQNPFTLEK